MTQKTENVLNVIKTLPFASLAHVVYFLAKEMKAELAEHFGCENDYHEIAQAIVDSRPIRTNVWSEVA